ncbi:hypothetical protein XarbCFBP8150_21395, partial [Xanthomonas arboricola]
ALDHAVVDDQHGAVQRAAAGEKGGAHGSPCVHAGHVRLPARRRRGRWRGRRPRRAGLAGQCDFTIAAADRSGNAGHGRR